MDLLKVKWTNVKETVGDLAFSYKLGNLYLFLKISFTVWYFPVGICCRIDVVLTSMRHDASDVILAPNARWFTIQFKITGLQHFMYNLLYNEIILWLLLSKYYTTGSFSGIICVLWINNVANKFKTQSGCIYSQTCHKGSPKGKTKGGCLRQVTP